MTWKKYREIFVDIENYYYCSFFDNFDRIIIIWIFIFILEFRDYFLRPGIAVNTSALVI
jgi:hypothetical protein